MPKSGLVLWFLAATAACDEAPTPVSAEPWAAVPGRSATSSAAQGTAGEPALSEDELERMLDALEREVKGR